MTLIDPERDTNRRRLLAQFGTGTFFAPLIGSLTTATQDDRQLRASVEVGEGDSDNWRRREYLTDEFGARIRLQGVSGGFVTYLIAVLDPTGELIEPKCDVAEVRGSSGEIYQTDPWYPTGGLLGIGEWQTGRYRLYATVADSDGNFAAATSDVFEIDPT